MTSNKDLEDRIDRRIESKCPPDWWHIISMTGSVLGIIALLIALFNLNPNYTPASPCELGLMEWEEPKIVMDFSNHCSKYGVDSQIIEWWSVIEEEAGCKWIWEGKNTCKCVSKSCPYSGPGIIVVKR